MLYKKMKRKMQLLPILPKDQNVLMLWMNRRRKLPTPSLLYKNDKDKKKKKNRKNRKMMKMKMKEIEETPNIIRLIRKMMQAQARIWMAMRTWGRRTWERMMWGTMSWGTGTMGFVTFIMVLIY